MTAPSKAKTQTPEPIDELNKTESIRQVRSYVRNLPRHNKQTYRAQCKVSRTVWESMNK